MSRFNMTRRSFIKTAAVTGVAAAMMSSASPLQALAEANTGAATGGSVKRVRSACRGCGKMECGVWVTVQDGRAIKIEGDPTAFASDGSSCSKSQASLQACYHPDRLKFPMKRTNPKGDLNPGWERITWDEAFAISGEKLKELIDKYGGPSLFAMVGTSRVWSMAGISAWLNILGTPNNIQAYQVCKGPRHFATRMVAANAFSWMETVGRPTVYVQWGGASEISNYDDSCRTTVDCATKATTHILVDPRTHGIGRLADIWVNLRPGTDAAVALSWAYVIIKNDLIDDIYCKKWTNLPFLVCEDTVPSGQPMTYSSRLPWTLNTKLLKESDLVEGGSLSKYAVWDSIGDKIVFFDATTGIWEGQVYQSPTAGKEAQQKGLIAGPIQGFVLDPTGFDVEDGFATPIDPALWGEYEVVLKDGRTSKVRTVMEHYFDRCSEYTPEKAQEITGVDAAVLEAAAKAYAIRVDPATGYGNGGIQYMLAVEHAANAIQNCRAIDALTALTGNYDTPAGMRGPTQAPVQGGFTPFAAFAPGAFMNDVHRDKEIGDEKIPLLRWWAGWADANSAYDAMETGIPYPIVGGLNTSGDFMNQTNAVNAFNQLNKLDFILESNLWHAPSTDTADVLMPVHHWLEINASRVSQGSSGAFGATVKAVEAPGDCMWDPVIVQNVAKSLGVNYGTDPTNPWPGAQWILDYAVAGFQMTWAEYEKLYEENGWWDAKVIDPVKWGTYRRYETTAISASGFGVKNPAPGWGGTPTKKHEIWSTIMEAHHPGEGFDLPSFTEPPHSPVSDPTRLEKYPFIATTGRRIPVYFHNEHRMLPWCRELWPVPRVEINPEDAERLGVEQGDWCWIETEWGKVRQVADLYYGIKPGVVNCEHQWWFPEVQESGRGFALSSINCVNDRYAQCPHCGATNLRSYLVNIYKATPENSPFGNPIPCDSKGNEIIHTCDDDRLKAWAQLDYEGR